MNRSGIKQWVRNSSAMALRVAAMTFISAVTAGSATAQAPEKFTFALNWFAVGDHAAYWVALEKGYYTQRGLEVVLENSKVTCPSHSGSSGVTFTIMPHRA